MRSAARWPPCAAAGRGRCWARAVIGLQAAKCEAGARAMPAPAPPRPPACDAAALHADVDLDQAAQLDAESCATREAASTCRSSIEAAARSSLPARAPQAGAASRSPTTWLLTSTSCTPPRTSASASPTFWQHWPTAPARSAAARSPGDLCVLACGRRRTPAARAKTRPFSRCCARARRGRRPAPGVSMSCDEAPINSAGGGVPRLANERS